jgi:hypothetical protein
MSAVHQIPAGVETKPGGAAKTQRNRILSLLIRARGAWVPLADTLPLAAQYGARISELGGKLNFNVENRTQEVDGVRHSWFRLIPRPSPSLQLDEKDPPKTYSKGADQKRSGALEFRTLSLFGDLSPERHRDDG